MTYHNLIAMLSNDDMSEITKMKLQKMINKSRCSKCVYEGVCTHFDQGECKNYKRDPPDGGYYG